MDIEIKKLTPELIEDYIDFFDNRAFTDNENWSACYCIHYHWSDDIERSLKESDDDVKTHNRKVACELVRNGVIRGYLAYADGRVVGWCNANDKSGYNALAKNKRPELWDDDNMKIISVVCFSIEPAMRRKGIATGLLERVCEDAAEEGYDIVEAYPVKNSTSIYSNYHGFMTLYEKLGFSVHREIEKEFIVRKTLKTENKSYKGENG